MSEFGSESDCYTYASPSPETRRNGPFLGVTMMLSDHTDSDTSLDKEGGVLSQSTQSDDQSREPVPSTSTPDLSFAASSSPLIFPARESPSVHATNFGNVAPRSKSSSDHTFFVRRLDYLLQQAADQQCHSRTSDDMRIQLNSPEDVSGPESQMEPVAHDVGLEPALGQREYNRHLSRSPSHQSRRNSSFFRGTSNDDRHNTLSTVPGDAGINSRRKKRKAIAAADEGSEASSTRLFRDGNPSDSYLSASDGDPPTSSRCLADCHQPSKKRRCQPLDMQSSVVSFCGSPAFSDANLISSKSLAVKGRQGSESNITYDATKRCITPSNLRILSAAGSNLSYPPTQLVTPVLGLSPVLGPVPVLGPRYFSQADIPRVFLSSDDAAGARLTSLLRKEVLFWREEGLGSLLALDFSSPNTLEVIAWILAVEPPFGSPTAPSIRGRAHSYDLHEQLTVNHDSRFFAAYIFSLFFFIPARRDSKTLLELDQSDVIHYQDMKDGKDTNTWDYAVAAIALAVKMHRDNHPPLKPIFANHFLALACHEMRFEDLELAQRNLLRYFSYNLGMPTPQEFLDELRMALPTLRHALESKHEWEDVVSETWKQLIAAARCTCRPTWQHLIVPFRSVGPSMLRFTVSLLTATALIEAIKRVVNLRLSLTKLNAPAESLNSTCDCPTKHAVPGVASQDDTLEHESSGLELTAPRATGAVSADIRKVLDLSVEKMDECEKWFALVRSASEKPIRSKYFPETSWARTMFTVFVQWTLRRPWHSDLYQTHLDSFRISFHGMLT